MNDTQKRKLDPYEKNQLLKHGIDPEVLLNTDSPVEYITNYLDFCGENFYVDNNVLIPRVETEELVDLVVDQAKKIPGKTATIRIADVGTGSGAIAVSVAKRLNQLKIQFEIIGLDISTEALRVAERNHRAIDPELNIEFIQSDLLMEMINNDNLFDIIVANLPYIPSSRIRNLDNSVRNFEPHLALDGGTDGLDLIRKLLSQSKKLIKKTGKIFLELDITHNQKKMNVFSNEWDVNIFKSKYGGVYFGSLKLL